MIAMDGVSKRYGRRDALADVSLVLQPGELTLLLGANGAGKSTLLRCLLGITSYEGTIRVAGLDPLADGPAVRARIGYMPQTGGLHPDLTVRDTIAFYAGLRRVPVEHGLELVAEAGLTPHLDSMVGELSGGARQRLGFALALLTDPQILVLDEPSASLDAASRQWLARRLRAAADEGRTVLVSTHAGQELLEAGDCTVQLEDGRLSTVVRRPRSEARSVPRVPPAAARGRTRPIVMKELRDAITNRWLIAYAALIAALGFAATATGLDSSSGLALQAYGRTTATLVNLCLLLAPLVAVLMGAASIAGEQERGTLEHLLAQPLTRTQLLLGKHAGLLIAVTAATFAGFVPAGVLIAAAADPALLGHYVIFPAIAALAGAAMAGVGLAVSVTSRSAVQAQGTAVFVWFAFVLLYDLVLMGTLALGSLPIGVVGSLLLANPVDAARVLAVLALEPDLYLLGPAGAFLVSRYSATGAAALVLAALAAWTVLPVAAAAVMFSRPLRRRSNEQSERICAAAGHGVPRGGDCLRVGGRSI
jgi:ABC-type multidrug transport system ATPase subunit/ABC-type transport system involved in multi-copper enzyme maturation permease subunit